MHLRELSVGIGRIVDKVVDGTMPDTRIDRLKEMEAEKKALKADLATIDQDNNPIQLHPV